MLPEVIGSIILQRSLLPKEGHNITLPRRFPSLRFGNIDRRLLLRHRLILGERLPRRLFPGNCNKLVYDKRRGLSGLHGPKYPSSSLTVFFFITCRLPRRRPPCIVTSSFSSTGLDGGGCSTGVGSRGSSSASGISSSGSMSVQYFLKVQFEMRTYRQPRHHHRPSSS